MLTTLHRRVAGHLAALIANCHRVSEQPEKAEQDEQEHTGLARGGKRRNVNLSVHHFSTPQFCLLVQQSRCDGSLSLSAQDVRT